MKVVVISKTPHTVAQWSNVTKIEESGTNIVITDNGTPYTYSKETFFIQIIQ